ncbi:MAG: pyridoxal 5'-phosphate synthase glutaminase subunit PdxT [Bryobacteraceae bacterium]
MSENRLIGVLALQGDYEAHRKALARAGAESVPVRKAAELDRVAGLVIPGGESTTILNLLQGEGMFEPLREFGARKPVFGTCAGAILLASEVSRPSQESLGLVEMAVARNAYGRQVDSRVVRLAPEPAFGEAAGDGGELEAVFIRAPIIRSLGACGKVLLRYQGDPVLVDFGRHLVATFHPELTEDPRVHRIFVSKI